MKKTMMRKYFLTEAQRTQRIFKGLMFVILFLLTTKLFADDKYFLLPFGYDYIHLDKQTIHNPALGIGYLQGNQDIPFDEVDRRVLALALWRPVIFSDSLYSDVPKVLHNAEALVDFRLVRHQLLFFFNSSSDKPVFGGLNTFQAGAGWGYEIVRKKSVSLILGAAVAVGEFAVGGIVLSVLPTPLIRFGVDTQWFTSSFDFFAVPNLEFTIAPKERIRFTADMRMDYFRSIEDVICEFILWYRFFDVDHKLGDFAGIGIGFKNDSMNFSLSKNKNDIESFELQRTSIIAVLDLSIVKLEGGWIFDSRYLVNEKKTDSMGKGFYVSIQGIIPIRKK